MKQISLWIIRWTGSPKGWQQRNGIFRLRRLLYACFNADFATYELNDRTNYNSIDAYTQFNTDTELAYLGNNQTTTYKLYMEFQLNWARKFGKHDITAMALYKQNDYRYQADLAERPRTGRACHIRLRRPLPAEVNFGYNGSEKLHAGRRFGFFPSFSVGWRISNEAFMKSERKTG